MAFTAPWCAHCRAMADSFGQLAARFDGSIIFTRVEAHEGEGHELLDRFQIDAFPSLLWFYASRTYPYYASEVRPEKYKGWRTFGAMATFLTDRSGITQAEAADGDAAAEALRPCDETLQNVLQTYGTTR